ncbi:MAG: VOC family protein [Chloroflexi bacterium]|nr:VOC family protein [Chloroflexota bacterium]
MTTQDDSVHARAAVQPIPQHYGSLTTYVCVRGAAQFLDFLKAAFGAVERGRVQIADGSIGHAEVWIGNRVLNMFDAKATWPDMPSLLSLYVDDCDAVFEQALSAGATTITELSTNAWGDRMGRLRDPFGNIWWITTHVEDVSQEQVFQRMQQPHYLEQMRYAQETIDRELSSRRETARQSTTKPTASGEE